MRKYAAIQDYIVQSVMDLEEEQLIEISPSYQNVIDITDMTPQPQESWIFNGSTFLPNYSGLTADEIDRIRMKARFVFGNKLCDDAIEMISVRNRALGKTSQQVNTIIGTFMPLEMALRKCALPTALGGIMQMSAGYPEYAQEFQYLIAQLSDYIANEI